MRLHARRIVFGPLIALRLRLAGVKVGTGVRLFGSPIVRRWRGSAISVGAGSELRSSRRSNVLGVSHPVVLATMTKDARIEVGERCGLSGTTLCAAESIAIGADCLFGADTLVTDNDHHALVADLRLSKSMAGVGVEPIKIGSRVFIGARAIILKGTSIGDDAIVGAGSVVAGDVPAKAIVIGNPARVVGSTEGR
jgi:bifunctional N-acetylglucosamine-1-phosphate-uridyltransferase/glucosamine-1-phosphate-acetyltransferase GlmU-like protein